MGSVDVNHSGRGRKLATARESEPSLARQPISGIVARRAYVDVVDLIAVSDLIVVAAPLETGCRWEGGRIVTLTRIDIDRHVAGARLGAAETAWARTRGGTVGAVSQFVDGEASFGGHYLSLLFLVAQSPRRAKGPTVFQTVGGAEGQFPVVWRANGPRLVASPWRSILKPKDNVVPHPFEARSLDEVVSELGDAWNRLHAAS